MCRHFPTYLRRWCALTLGGFGMGCLFERTLQASLWPAWFFIFACLTLTGTVVMLVAWAFLASARMH
jgi:hypothetical protein